MRRFIYPWLNPWICGRVENVQATLAANFSQVQLFNSDPTRYCVVLDFSVSQPTSAFFTMATVKGQIAGSANQSVATVCDEGGPGPVAIAGTTTTAITPDYTAGMSNTLGYTWSHEFPFTVLKAGWGLTIQSGVVNQTLNAAFYFAMVYPADLLALHHGVDAFDGEENRRGELDITIST